MLLSALKGMAAIWLGGKYSTYDTKKTAWLNGAWCAFQEQQKKIDAIVDLCNNNRGYIHWKVDSFIEEIEELLK